MKSLNLPKTDPVMKWLIPFFVVVFVGLLVFAYSDPGVPAGGLMMLIGVTVCSLPFLALFKWGLDMFNSGGTIKFFGAFVVLIVTPLLVVVAGFAIATLASTIIGLFGGLG